MTNWSQELQSALLTAENHGDAYRLLHHPDCCRAELRKVIANHHPEVSDIEAKTIVETVLTQWLADKAESAEAKVSASIQLQQLPLGKPLPRDFVIAATHILKD